ncbi:MAG: pyridoxal phosphate-dependent aminotransferase [Alphaproteobacteria bacterium]|nr:pyridoxal phosphate-dependent aminotransferase [Alphaproteobacteria bacterium]
MRVFKKSNRLDGVRYEIRGPVLKAAQRLEEAGYKILKLNIGNPATFDLNAPEEIVKDVILNMPYADGYSDSKGIFPARKAVMHYCQQKKIQGVQINDIYLGNGVSDLILFSMEALLDNGDEVLVPMPDYPLWTASICLAGGKAVHYLCDEESDWYPDIKDIESKITPKTKAIVVINPNNPTGAVYPTEILKQLAELAERHHIAVFCDEIYDKILYDGVQHTSLASLISDTFCITFNGISKNYRAAGFRAAWMVLSGNKKMAEDYIEGLDLLSNMRLCSNVPGQYAIQTALGGYQSINDLVVPGGRLYEQRTLCHQLLTDIPGITCVKAKGSLYMFPKIDTEKFNIKDDQKFVLDLLTEKHILLVNGRGFNWEKPDHFRVVFLPRVEDLTKALTMMKDFLAHYKQVD